MGLYNDGYEETTFALDRSMAADFATPAHSVAAFDMGSIQAVWVGAAPSLILPAKLQVEASIDGLNWCNVFPDAFTKKVSLAAGCVMYTLQNVEYKWMRCLFERRSNTGGTMTIYAFLKRRRANNP